MGYFRKNNQNDKIYLDFKLKQTATDLRKMDRKDLC